MIKAIPILVTLFFIGCNGNRSNLSKETTEETTKEIVKANEETVMAEQTAEISSGQENSFTNKTFDAVLEQIGQNRNECDLALVAEEKIYANRELTVWVLPRKTISEGYGQDDEVFDVNCTVVLADTKTGKIKSLYDESLQFESNAYKLTGFSVESYFSYDDRFAVIAHFQGSSRIYPAGSGEASLFIVQGHSLKKIYEYTASKYCEEATENYTKDLIFLKDRKSNGLSEIMVKRQEEDVDDPDYQLLRYNGRQYEVYLPDDTTIIHFSFADMTLEAGKPGFEEWFYFGKTPEQAYAIWRDQADYKKHYLKPVLPDKDIIYTLPLERKETDDSPGDSLNVCYEITDVDYPKITLSSSKSATYILIVEKKGYVHITVSVD